MLHCSRFDKGACKYPVSALSSLFHLILLNISFHSSTSSSIFPFLREVKQNDACWSICQTKACLLMYLNCLQKSKNGKTALSNVRAIWSHLKPGLGGYTTFFMLNSAEHEICPANTCKSKITNNYKFFLLKKDGHENSSANKYENANYWHFHIYQQSKFHAQLN